MINELYDKLIIATKDLAHKEQRFWSCSYIDADYYERSLNDAMRVFDLAEESFKSELRKLQ